MFKKDNHQIVIPPPNKNLPPLDLSYKDQTTYVMTLYFQINTQINLSALYNILPIYTLDESLYPRKKYDIADLKDICDGAIISIRWDNMTKGFSKLKFTTKKINGFKEQIIFTMSIRDKIKDTYVSKLVSVKFWADGLIHITGGTSTEVINSVYKHICNYLCHRYQIIDNQIIIGEKYREYPEIIEGSKKCSMDNKRFYLDYVVNKLEFRKAFKPLIEDIKNDPSVPQCVSSIRVYLAPKKAGIILEFNLKSQKKKCRITFTFWNKVAICSGSSDKEICHQVFEFLIKYLNEHRHQVFSKYDFDNEWRTEI